MPDRMSECSPNEEDGADQLVSEDGDASQRKAPSSGACLWDRVRSRLLRPKVNNGPGLLRLRFGPFNSLKTLHRTKDYLNGISLAQQHLPRGAGPAGRGQNITLSHHSHLITD